MKTSRQILVLAILMSLEAVPLLAHEMTVKGTVAAIEKTRIQVKTGLEKPGEQPSWYAIDDQTKVKRGKDTVRLAEAKIAVDERVVVIVDHPGRGPIKTKEIRLAAH
jgi:hypothetical protein